MSVRNPHGAHKVDEIGGILKPSLNGSKFEPSVLLWKDESEIIRGVDNWVYDKLGADAHNHHDAEDGGLLLEGVVVLENEPF